MMQQVTKSVYVVLKLRLTLFLSLNLETAGYTAMFTVLS